MSQTNLLANIDYILAGMFQDQNTGAKDLDKRQESFATKLYGDLRSVYDEYMPNVHVLDADRVARELVIGIMLSPEAILSIADESYKPLVVAGIKKHAPKLREAVRNAVSELHTKVSKKVSGNPVALLNTKLEQIISNYKTLNSDSYIEIGKQFNAAINSIMSKGTAFIGITAEAVGIEAREHRYIFLQKSFVSGKDTINKAITQALIPILKKIPEVNTYSNILDVGSITGKFIDFGHVGGKLQGTNRDLSINTPALTKIIYNVANLSTDAIKVGFKDVTKAKSIFINKTGHISQAITVTKTFTDNTTTLMQIGLTLTTDMPSEYNRIILGKKEQRLSDRAVADRLNSSELLRRGLLERMKDTFLGPNIQKLYKGKSSLSIEQYLIQYLMYSLSGKGKKPSESQKKTRSKNNTVLYKELKTGNLPKLRAARQPKQKPSQQQPSTQVLNIGSSTNLVSLQNLLNANLAQKIKENMGDGTRKDILNLRSGRLAESAKVERLSESRQGMITAFYTYMKNPYATFSEGGKQQSPRSRDPKLLISKSIREIAATQVANRMRAVLI